MIGKQIISSEPVSFADVIEILSAEEKEHALSYEQDAALKHAKRFAPQPAEAKRLKERLGEIPHLSKEAMVRLLDIRPTNEMLLKNVLAQTKETLSDNELSKLLAALK